MISNPWDRNASTCWHDDVIKWKHFPRYWPFVWGIHRSQVNSPHKGQLRGALMFSLIFDVFFDLLLIFDLWSAHYDVTVMCSLSYLFHEKACIVITMVSCNMPTNKWHPVVMLYYEVGTHLRMYCSVWMQIKYAFPTSMLRNWQNKMMQSYGIHITIK